jgi:peptidyl-tRNA hydrolase, PTH1 family
MEGSDTPQDNVKRKLVVGLGNPGHEYVHTRHNIGWRVLDAMELDFHFEKKFQANIAKTHDCFYIQPTTFMNCSGEAVRAIVDYYHLDPRDLIVVYDDKDIPFGSIRLRSGGSSAGHNGVQSIIQHLGTDAFARVRVGVQQEKQRNEHVDTAHFVLSDFTPEEENLVPQLLESAIGSVVFILDNGITPQDHKDLSIFAPVE